MPSKVNKKNLRQLCWKKGYAGVSGLAKAIGRNRCVIHHAVSNPGRYQPTIRLLEKILL